MKPDDAGLPVHKAMYDFALPETDTISYAVANWRKGWTSPRSFDHDTLLRDIAIQARKNLVRLMGRKHGEQEATWLHPDILSGAFINLATNELRSGELIFYGVRVFAVRDDPVYQTGVGGRPTSKQLFMSKMHQRAAAGEMNSTLKAEADWLAAWLISDHPDAPRATSKTIQEALRADHRRLKTGVAPGPETLPKTISN